MALVVAMDSATSPENFQAILQDVADFAGNAKQYDDMTIVILKKTQADRRRGG